MQRRFQMGSTLGVLAIAGAALLWAIGGTYAASLFERGASPIELTEARSWIALAGVGLMILIRRERPRQSVAETFPGLRKGVLIAFGIALATANSTYYLALSKLPVAVAIVLQYTAPGLIVLWKWIADGVRPTRRVICALLFALAGVVLVAEAHKALNGGIGGLDSLGVAFALASSLSFAAYLILGEAVEGKIGPIRGVFSGFLVASFVWILVQAWRGSPSTLTRKEFLLPIAFLGIATTIAPFLLFLFGLGKVKASAAGIISTLEPVSAALIAYLWLGQILTPIQATGAALVLVGIAIVQWDSPGAGHPDTPSLHGGRTP